MAVPWFDLAWTSLNHALSRTVNALIKRPFDADQQPVNDRTMLLSALPHASVFFLQETKPKQAVSQYFQRISAIVIIALDVFC